MTTPTITWEYYTGSAWVNISSYVLRGQSYASYGISTNRHNDRLAKTGELQITLNNQTRVFDPENTSTLTGFGKNTKLKLTITFDSVTKIFYGTIGNITFNDTFPNDATASIAVFDFMQYLYNFTLTQESIQTDKRADQVINTILTSIGHTPLDENMDAGNNVFDAAFDSVSGSTKAATEANKAVLSEGGYLYVKKDQTYGETLVFENSTSRNGFNEVTKIPKSINDCVPLLDQNDNELLDQNDVVLYADESEDCDINGTAKFYSRTYGEQIVNKVTISAYPKRTDDTEQTLYSLGSPLYVGAGETKTFTARYQNATTKESCNAITSLMVAPVATTDYLANTAKGATSGTNLTASFTVTATYYTSEVSYSVTNGSTKNGWLNMCKARGYGVYQDSQIEKVIEDTASQTAYGVQELNFDQRYQRDIIQGERDGNAILYMDKDPHTRLESVTIDANVSDKHMMAFLKTDIGDLVRIRYSTLELDDYYYVQGISFTVESGFVLRYTWLLKTAYPLLLNMTPVILEKTELGSGYIKQYLPSFYNAEYKTIIASVKFTSASDYVEIIKMGNALGTGFKVQVNSYAGKLYLEFTRGYSVVRGLYYTGQIAATITDWNTIAVKFNTHDKSAPELYINGVSCAVTTGITPDGDDGLNDTSDTYRFLTDGDSTVYLKQIKMYEVGLTDIEIAADAAGTLITRGIVYYGTYVRNADVSHYTDLLLTTSDALINGAYGEVSMPTGNTITARFE